MIDAGNAAVRPIKRVALWYLLICLVGVILSDILSTVWPSYGIHVMLIVAAAGAFALTLRKKKTPDPACVKCSGKGFIVHKHSWAFFDGEGKEECPCVIEYLLQ